MRKLLPIVSLLIVSILLMLPLWVLADTYEYRVPITIYNNGSAVQGPVGIVVTISNAQLAELGYINAAGLDTNLVEGATEQTYGAVESYIGVFINSIAAYQTNTYQYQLGNSPAQTGFPVIVGPGGDITVSDDSSMELGNNFTVSIQGYVDTSAGSDKNLVYKREAFRTYVSATGNITADFLGELVTNSSASDGYIFGTSTDYATARTTSTGISNNLTVLVIGQSYVNPNYGVFRSYVYFNTSRIPDDAVIDWARLRLSGETDNSDTDFSIVIQNGQPVYPRDPLIIADYNFTYYSGNGGSLSTSGFTTSGYNTIEFNTTTLSWINVTGITKLVLRSSRDIAGTQPSGFERVTVYATEEAGTDRDPQLVVSYYSSGVTSRVTATGVSSGLHTINVTADTTDLKIYVDGSEEDSVALGGASVPDNGYDWYLSEGGVLPYMTSYRHAVNGTEVVWFEPVAMPSSANLPDRTGSANTGALNVGNPGWAEITVGGVVPFSAYAAGGVGPPDPPEVLPGDLDLTLHEDPGATGVGLPLYKSVNAAAEALGWSAAVFYVILILIICAALGFTAFKITGSVIGFAALFGMTAAAAGGVQDANGAFIFPWWIALVCVIMALTAAYTWRHT